MIIKDWMTKDVITVDPETSMMRAAKLMKEKGIRRLPVVDDKGKVVGMLSDRDVKEASPSKATTLDVHELYYLLSEIKVKNIMSPNPLTILDTDTVVKCAAIMHDKKISGLPVLNEQGELVGIMTQNEVYRVLLSITGIYHGGIQIGLKLPDQRGTLKEVLDCLRGHKARVISILTSYDKVEDGYRQVFLRVMDMEKSVLNELKKELSEKYDLMFWVRDSIN
ncbi:CBS and ACT domain-containing protein [Desulfomicrobium escambiense]|uniref:CBS and ACT domain-containing protein n=1 Tax=Desulfomicrobium escambiense TaxID=29503 RepID=UPI00041D20AA|nr:CBS and ACT domain-containing protein [Desulfomicrobium escambiense]